QEEPDITRQVCVVAGILPVTIENKDSLALTKAGVSIGILDSVDVRGQVAILDPLLQMLGSQQILRRINRRARLLENPVVDRINRAVGGHQVLKREGKSHPTFCAAPLHDREKPGGLSLGQQGVKLGECLWWLSHANLGRLFLVVEDSSQTVVEAHGIK